MTETQEALEEARELEATMLDVSSLAKTFSSDLSRGLQQAVISGKDLETIFSQMALRLSANALSSALKPLETALGNGLTSLFSSSAVTPFAKGGVVSSPIYFAQGAGSGLGLMGEAGAEAILPLQRSADGRLGVAMHGASGQPNVTINVQTQGRARL